MKLPAKLATALAALVALGIVVVLSMADVGADVMLAVLDAVTPPGP